MLQSVFRKRSVKNGNKTLHFRLRFTDWAKSTFLKLVRRESKKDRQNLNIRKVGMRRIERELDIVHFLKKQMFIAGLLKAMTTKF